jgi:hypothetical protein
MATVKTNKSDVIANFVRYHGRQPRPSDMATIDYLTTKSPQEVEAALAKNSPVTGGKLWADYQNYKAINEKTVALSKGIAAGTIKTQADVEKQGLTAPINTTRSIANTTPVVTNNTTAVQNIAQDNAQKNTPNANIAEPVSTVDQAGLDRLNKYIDGLSLTQTEKDFLKATFVNKDTYTSGKTVPTNEQIAQWISDAATNAQTDINPYYQKITAQELEDYKNQMADIRNASQRYAQAEASAYKQKLAETKQSLRARGLTFSGVSRATLGKEGVLDAAGIEGSVPQARRYGWEDKLAGWQEQARDIGTAAERKLGSTTLSNEEGLYSPYDLANNNLDYQAGRTQAIYTPHRAVDGTGYYAGYGEKPTTAGAYTSENELQRLKDIETSKQQRLTQYRLTL